MTAATGGIHTAVCVHATCVNKVICAAGQGCERACQRQLLRAECHEAEWVELGCSMQDAYASLHNDK